METTKGWAEEPERAGLSRSRLSGPGRRLSVLRDKAGLSRASAARRRVSCGGGPGPLGVLGG